jgi:6-pyruvoyl-tetrahydropterin synthase
LISDKTNERLAKKHGVSEATIVRAAKFANGVNAIASVAPDKKDEILQGKSDFTKKDIADFAQIKAEVEEKAKELAKEMLLQKEAEKRAKFENEYDVIAWIINNQLGRRNLTAQEMSYLRGLEYENEKARHGKHNNRANQYTKKKVESPQNEDFPLSDKTYEKLADKHGVSFKKSGLGFKPE